MKSDSDSEFGYDFSVEEEELLLQLAAGNPPPSTAPDKERLAGIASGSGKADVLAGQNDAGNFAGAPVLGLESLETGHALEDSQPSQSNLPEQEVCYPDLSVQLSKIDAEPKQAAEEAQEHGTTDDYDDPLDDGRSPLQRFRSYPRRPLTVTDLNAGAWCELQYWYTLVLLPGGRKTRTKAMKQGSKLHQKLEDELGPRVKVDIVTKEDGFAMRLWNLVQGLRTLRQIGFTRELEVWGMVDGNLVNGVIDSVSYENPDAEFEELLKQNSDGDTRQKSLTDYFPSSQPGQSSQFGSKIYLTDVKTRGSLAPVTNAMLRPAKIQLLLYHRFLSDMAAGNLDFFKVFRRHGLDPDDTFSDTFIAQMGSLHDEIFVDAPSSSSEAEPLPADSAPDSAPSATQTSTDSSGPDLLKYRSLRELVPLVQEELAATFPNGEDSMGDILRVQYIHRDDGREIDTHDFPVSQQALENYLSNYMSWWRGERKPKGVDIEEAFKCRTCEFVSDCTWRQSMDGARLRKAQQKVWAGRRVGSD